MEFDFDAPPRERHDFADRVWTVSELAEEIRAVLAGVFSTVVVDGEITDLKRSTAGHVYFALKDAGARLDAVLWKSSVQRLRFELANGLAVRIVGRPEVYPPQGRLQLIARDVQPQGLGPLELAFKQLKERLEKLGLFAKERKRPIPRFPSRVAVVTSPTGAAVRDFLEVALRRWRGAEIVVVPSLVQGDAAPKELVAALKNAARIGADVVALIRGGGSMEDLWAFNHESLAYALASSPIPVVAGVGHETDLTIADLVADVRALTPTEAAERIFPNRDDLRRLQTQLAGRLAGGLRSRLQRADQRLTMLASAGVMRYPLRRIELLAQRLDEREGDLGAAGRRFLEAAARKLQAPSAALAALDPHRVLARGYALVSDARTGTLVIDAQQTAPGAALAIRLGVGQILAEVTDVQKTES